MIFSDTIRWEIKPKVTVALWSLHIFRERVLRAIPPADSVCGNCYLRNDAAKCVEGPNCNYEHSGRNVTFEDVTNDY